MKRIGGLFDQVWPRDRLVDAASRAALGKRQRREIHAFIAGLDSELASMSDELRQGSYRFAAYRSFAVRDTKSRTIHAPTFRDRVAHHAIIGATGPAFELGAMAHSYACRRGMGQHAALRQALRWTRTGDWYGKIDVEKFYDSVDHGVLRRLLERRFREARLLALFDRVLESYHTAPDVGLPIGALTSQYLGNFLLDEFDRRMKVAGDAHRYARYMDDVVIWGDAAAIGRLRALAGEVLSDLGLRLKHGGEWNRCEQGVPFLGFVVYPGRLRLGATARRRLRRRTGLLERAWHRGEIDDAELQARVTSIFAHARQGHDREWRRSVVRFGRCQGVVDAVDSAGSGEAHEPRPSQSRGARRRLEQHRQEVPLGVPQQEEARQPQQESGLPGLSGSRHDGDVPPDDASSRSLAGTRPDPDGGSAGNQPSGTAPTDADIHAEGASRSDRPSDRPSNRPSNRKEKGSVGAAAPPTLWSDGHVDD